MEGLAFLSWEIWRVHHCIWLLGFVDWGTSLFQELLGVVDFCDSLSWPCLLNRTLYSTFNHSVVQIVARA